MVDQNPIFVFAWEKGAPLKYMLLTDAGAFRRRGPLPEASQLVKQLADNFYTDPRFIIVKARSSHVEPHATAIPAPQSDRGSTERSNNE